MLKIGRMMIGSYQTNCYFIYNEGENKAIVVDPADQGQKIYDALKRNGFTVEAILLTHAHFDHIWGAKELREAAGVKIYALDKEEALCTDVKKNLSAMVGRPYTLEADEYLQDGQEVTIANMTFRVIATPGHTCGSCCYYFENPGVLISGDTLFYESTGRTDFPTGSSREIVNSIKEKLFVLPDDTLCYPGHGESTTIEHEKQYNPFIN